MPTRSHHIPSDHPSFAGHFPGRPVLPGVVLLTEVLEALLADDAVAAALGPGCRIGAAKFLCPVGPSTDLLIGWRVSSTRVQFEVHKLDAATPPVLAASGHFEPAVQR